MRPAMLSLMLLTTLVWILAIASNGTGMATPGTATDMGFEWKKLPLERVSDSDVVGAEALELNIHCRNVHQRDKEEATAHTPREKQEIG
jgi:hypothetical protein